MRFLLFIFVFSFAALSQSAGISVRGLKFEFEKTQDGKLDVKINNKLIQYKVREYIPVFFDNLTQEFEGVYLVNDEHGELLYFSMASNGGFVAKHIPVQLDGKLQLEEVLLKDGGYTQKAVVIDYLQDSYEGKTSYEKILHFYDSVLNENFEHFYTSDVKLNAIPLIRYLDGEETHLFRTGDTYFEHPYSRHINTGTSVKTGEVINLPKAPKQIEDFKIIRKSDLTANDISEAKAYILNDSEDYKNILENYHEGIPAIIGEAGEGKSYALKSFYKAALLGLVPGIEVDEVLILNKTSLAKNTNLRGQAEDKLAAVIKYYQDGKGRRLVAADEIHTIKSVGGDAGDTSGGALQALKSEMADGTFKMITTTTEDEFYAMIGGDTALERRFLKTRLIMKSHEKVVKIVRGMSQKKGYEISDELIEKVIYYSEQFDVAGKQPAKATKLLSKATAKQRTLTPNNPVVTLEAINLSAQDLYSANYKMLDPRYALQKALELTKFLDSKVIGLDNIKKVYIEAVRQRYLGMKPSNKPPIRILLIGPSGVGKTFINEVLAEGLEGNSETISMNNYSGHHTSDDFLNEIASLLRKDAFTYLTLDEFEKASKPVQISNLQMLNNGEFDQKEKIKGSEQVRSTKISTKNTPFLMTSNLAGEEIKKLFVDILQIEMEKTQDIAKAEANAKKIFYNKLTPRALKGIAIEAGLDPAIADRVTIMAVHPPTPTEFRQNIELYTKVFLKDYKQRMNLDIKITNFKATVDSIMTHYQPGLSNRDAQNLIEDIIQPQISANLSADILEKNVFSIKLDIEALKFISNAPKTTQKLKILIARHELFGGHWTAEFMLNGKNTANYVTIIPGDGYLGYVRPKVTYDLISETNQTFTGLFKRAVVLEAGYRAEKLGLGIHGTGAGSINRKAGKAPTDDLGKINNLFDTWIANNMFDEMSEKQFEQNKVSFKIQMTQIVREVTDYVVQKGLKLGVGKEAYEKLLTDGKLHMEYLDQYAAKLNKELKLNPDQILIEALEFAKTKLSALAGKNLSKSKANRKIAKIEKLIGTVGNMLASEAKFLGGQCDNYFQVTGK